MEKVLAIVLFLVGLYIFLKRDHFMPSSKTLHPCPPGFVHLGSGDCKLATDIHDPR
jgi:hypothetical protein